MYRPVFLIFCVAILAYACQNTIKKGTKDPDIKFGSWKLQFILDTNIVDIQMNIDSAMNVQFINASETIEAGHLRLKQDSFYLEMPIYGTYFTGVRNSNEQLKGYWHNTQKGPNYLINISAKHRSSAFHKPYNFPLKNKYQVTFSPNSDNQYPALGLLSDPHKGAIIGTFLTETGDYRFLHGNKNSNNLVLQCFDGSHLFHFEGEVKGDSIVNGLFRSGSHWQEPWYGAINKNYELNHPDSITTVLDHAPIELNLINTQGEFVKLGADHFANKLTIVQILGTWCPNCLDESRFYKELHTKYASQGLQIIPVAFERTEDHHTSAITLERYLKALDLPYKGYIGGKASKKIASDVFPMLSDIVSFPTSIIVDSQGIIRKVHTGFFGPGTGMYYDRYKSNTEIFIQQNLPVIKP